MTLTMLALNMLSVKQRIQRLEAQSKTPGRPLTDVERAVRLHAMLQPGHPRSKEAMALLRRQGWR